LLNIIISYCATNLDLQKLQGDIEFWSGIKVCFLSYMQILHDLQSHFTKC
jgi:hypothetical protein